MAAVKWLDEAEMTAWKALVRTTTGLLATLDAELQAEHGLTLGDYEVLAILSDAPDRSMRMSELAGLLHLSPSGITRRIDGLVRADLVERQRCPSDRRGLNAVLTPVGVKRLEDAAPTHLEGVRRHFVDRLSARQLASLAAALSAADFDATVASTSCDERA